LVDAMDRLDRMMAELDDAVARLDERTAPRPGRDPAPPVERRRARWYWTMPASTAPPAPAERADVAEVSPPP
jgi:hypothetical protein